MLSIVNEVDPLIFCCVCFVCNTNMCFSNMGVYHLWPLRSLLEASFTAGIQELKGVLVDLDMMGL